ncbi:MAG: DNA mismatch repair endonuclease MutL [Chloroflexi bacterium]|nr:DNA mismatch repair endonuclease MutL [Chloroflexota bacterium]
MPIQVLPDSVAARIAAGEVIERPASVVKELVENSFDAGATRIRVDLSDGGRESISVRDNGDGIEPDEVELAFERFATSKLSSDDELMGIATLGFRGEALPSIASVSIVEVQSTTSDGTVGRDLLLEFGKKRKSEQIGAPPGTSVTVRSLFQNVPARKRFLSSASGELSRVHAVLTNYAMARPDVAIEFVADGATRWATGGTGNLRDVIVTLQGAEAASLMLEVDSQPDGSEMAVSGLAGSPSLSRGNRNFISLNVNGRWFLNRRISYAVEQAYHGFLGERRFPIAALTLRIPDGDVDVNVHPTKAEVKFLREQAVFGMVQKSVRQALLDHAPIPSVIPPRAPGIIRAGGVVLPPLANPLWPNPLTPGAPPPPSVMGDHQIENDFTGPSTPRDTLPVLRLLGQAHETYLIAEGPDGLYMIDQHAAHERVIFEEIIARANASEPESQHLLVPETFELTPDQEDALMKVSDQLGQMGFVLEDFGPRTLLVRAVPRVLGDRSASKTLLEILDGVIESVAPGAWTERTYATLACHSSVTAGRRMNDDEARELLKRLEAAEQPNTCPHGRPTMIHMSETAMAREFHRT